MSGALGLVMWFSCLKMLLQLLLWYYLLTAPTTPPTRYRRRNAVHISGIWSVLTADMKPATVQLMARLDAYIGGGTIEARASPVFGVVRNRMERASPLFVPRLCHKFAVT